MHGVGLGMKTQTFLHMVSTMAISVFGLRCYKINCHLKHDLLMYLHCSFAAYLYKLHELAL